MGNRVDRTLTGLNGGAPVSVHVRALVLQKDDLPRVMATHFSTGVVDDAVLIISGKQLQTPFLYGLHLRGDNCSYSSCLKATF